MELTRTTPTAAPSLGKNVWKGKSQRSLGKRIRSSNPETGAFKGYKKFQNKRTAVLASIGLGAFGGSGNYGAKPRYSRSDPRSRQDANILGQAGRPGGHAGYGKGA